MIPRNLGILFKDTARRLPGKKAFFFKQNNRYESFTWQELSRKVDVIASFFLDRGVKPGDRIAILSENRPEWALVDLAAQMIGAVSVPIYTSLTSSEIQYILKDSGSRLLAVSGKALFEKIPPVQKSLPSLEAIVAFDASLSLSQNEVMVPILLMKDIEKTAPHPDLEDNLNLISPDAVASIIYTSGTTGEPKGVMLTHSNFIHNVVFSRDTLKMSEDDAALSFLPLSHIFERMAGYYLMVYLGASIAYAETMDTVPQNLLETKPTFVLGVPRFYEKIQARVLEAVEKAGPVRKALFFWAKEIGQKKRMGRSRGGILGSMERALAEALVYKKFRARLGGRVRFCISGGAALAKNVAEFFCDLGVMIYEGYGLTETSPVMSVNREGKFKFGSVGIPLEGVEVRISEEGEILTKSACVMKGYFNKPEETEAVLKNGWFCTGDLGCLDKEGFLSITGRKKEIIVTSGGKKVSPRPIEELLEKDPLILRCVLFGEGKKFITALIVPREESLTEYAKERKMAFSCYADLLKDKKIYDFLDSRVQSLMADLASFEKIKYFALLEHDFSQNSGELTPTLKVKREVVFSRYQNLLLPFYETAISSK